MEVQRSTMKSVLYTIIGSAVCILIASALVACPAQESNEIIIGMVTDVGGLGDKSFNDGVHEGLQKVESRYDVDIRLVESNQQTDYLPNLSGYAEDGANLVFAVGFLMAEAAAEAASIYPDTNFAGVDIFIDEASAPSNLQGILFNEHESGYLAGVLAGLLTKEYAYASDKLNDANVVGTILGLYVPPVERFDVGFRYGVHQYNPEAEVLSIITESFTDQAKGKEAAISMIDQGADIIFPIAGGTGIGSIEAAKERNIMAIGVDVDQNFLAPDTIVTSAVKRLSQAAFLIGESQANGTFIGGRNVVLGIKEDATGLAPFHGFDSVIPDEVKQILADEVAKMKSGAVKVPTTQSELASMGIQ